MAAAQFSDDAYNKQLTEGQGTLIGNWYEERVLRESCGEGRTVPQRHIPRSGLLVDWSKTPSSGPRRQDDTFDRVYGPKADTLHVPVSKMIGGGEDDIFGDRPVAETLQAAGRIPRRGAKAELDESARFEAAELEVREEEAEIDARAHDRHFDTSTGIVHSKPNPALTELPTKLSKSCRKELMHGPDADRLMALGNEGLEFNNHNHYSNQEPVTHPRQQLADPVARSGMQVSACAGMHAFGRHMEFSKPMEKFCLGLSKDEELEAHFASLKGTKPLRSVGGSVPVAQAFKNLPSLAALKEALHTRIAETFGAQGYVILRQELFNRSDEEGFVHKQEVMSVFRELLNLSEEEVPTPALAIWLDQLITMKKQELHVGVLMASLRPTLQLTVKRKILVSFRALSPVDGAVRLGSWLDTLRDPALRRTIAQAFGSLDEDGASVASMPLTESVFIELISDLSALMDVGTLLD